MSKFKKLLLIIMILGISSLVVFGIKLTYESVHGKNIVDYEWLSHNVEIVDSDLGQNIYVVDKDRDIDIYNSNYRKVIDEKLDVLTSTKYTFNSPLIIYNLYGTNNLSVNVFFDTDEEYYVDYTISCDNDEIVDFTRELYNEDGLTKHHKYQIVGLIKGYKNIITLNLRDKDGDIYNTKKIEIDLSSLYTGSNLILSNDNKTNNYDNNNSNGLYTVFGKGLYISMYDNNGVLRSEIPINSYKGNRILFYNNKIIFSISRNKFVVLDRFGRISNVLNTGKYLIHHDYKLDKDNILFLATDKNKNSIEDVLVKLDINSGKVTKLIDFDKVFNNYFNKLKKKESSFPDENEKGFDWIHINSFIYDSNSVIVSSRELSSIIKIISINDKPKIKYIIGDNSIWNNTKYSKYLYNKIGDFKIHSGQTDISLIGNINNKNHYINLFNCNYGKSNNSYYYKYKIDEEEKTFELVDSMKLPYSGVNGSIGFYDNNYIFNLTNKMMFIEYNEKKKLIHKYRFYSDDVYRVYKYNYCKYWYK